MTPLARRTIPALLLAPCVAQAQGDFPGTVTLDGRELRRQGEATARYLLFPIYRVALYLAAPSRDAEAILASAEPRLIRCRYLRDLPLDQVTTAWEASFATLCGCPLPAAFRAWLRPVRDGEEEAMAFRARTAELTGPGRPAARIEDPVAARTLLAAWIGPGAPNAALRRGLLGGT
ncbi:MAG: chalcone isomerase family protein [Pseudomonadota bacterium]